MQDAAERALACRADLEGVSAFQLEWPNGSRKRRRRFGRQKLVIERPLESEDWRTAVRVSRREQTSPERVACSTASTTYLDYQTATNRRSYLDEEDRRRALQPS